jgi:hypothetical protein
MHVLVLLLLLLMHVLVLQTMYTAACTRYNCKHTALTHTHTVTATHQPVVVRVHSASVRAADALGYASSAAAHDHVGQ